MINMPHAKKISELLAALGEPTRMRLIEQLANGPRFVGELAESLEIPLVNISHHLNVLLNAGLLFNTKQGRRVSYALSEELFTPSQTPDAIGILQIGGFRLTIVRNFGDGQPGKSKRRPD